MSKILKEKLKQHNNFTKNYRPDRRVNKPKLRKKDERRADLQIITSVSQADLYLWAGSIAIISVVLTIFLFLAIFKG